MHCHGPFRHITTKSAFVEQLPHQLKQNIKSAIVVMLKMYVYFMLKLVFWYTPASASHWTFYIWGFQCGCIYVECMSCVGCRILFSFGCCSEVLFSLLCSRFWFNIDSRPGHRLFHLVYMVCVILLFKSFVYCIFLSVSFILRLYWVNLRTQGGFIPHQMLLIRYKLFCIFF